MPDAVTLTKEDRVYIEFIEDSPKSLIRHYYHDDAGNKYQVSQVIDLSVDQVAFLDGRLTSDRHIVQQVLTGMGMVPPPLDPDG